MDETTNPVEHPEVKTTFATPPTDATPAENKKDTLPQPEQTHPDTKMKQPTEGSSTRKRKQNAFDNNMATYLEKKENKALKRKRSNNVHKKKEPFFIDLISGPVTGSPDRSPISLDDFAGEIIPEPPPSDTGSPTSTKNHSDLSGKSL